MKRRKTQAARREDRRRTKDVRMDNPSGNSNYGRKRAFLKSRGGWGFDYGNADPGKQDDASLNAKPWRSQS